jgi:hypothetical protein
MSGITPIAVGAPVAPVTPLTSRQTTAAAAAALTSAGTALTSDVTAAVAAIESALTSAGLTTSQVQSAVAAALAAFSTSTLTSSQVQSAVSSALAANNILTSTGQYISGEIMQFAVGTAPPGWTVLSSVPYNVMSQGLTSAPPWRPTGIGNVALGISIAGCSNGLLYLTGYASGGTNYFGSFNPATQVFTALTVRPGLNPSNPAPIVAIPGGLLLSTGSAANAANCYTYNPSTGVWTQVASQATAKNGQAMCIWTNASTGKSYVACVGSNTAITFYDISANSWSTLTTSKTWSSTTVDLCVLPSGHLLMMDYNSWLYAVYDPATDTWVQAAATIPFAKVATTPTPPVVGSATGAICYNEAIQTYTESTNTWSSATIATAWCPIYASSRTTVPGVGVFLIGSGNQMMFGPTSNITTLITASKN